MQYGLKSSFAITIMSLLYPKTERLQLLVKTGETFRHVTRCCLYNCTINPHHMALLIYGTKRPTSQFRLWIDTAVGGHSDVDAGE